MTIIKAGTGVNIGQDFTRLMVDTPIDIDAKAYSRPLEAHGWIAGDPGSHLGFMRAPRVRVTVQRRFLAEA